MTDQNQRLNSLYERQNSKRDARADRPPTARQGSERPNRVPAAGRYDKQPQSEEGDKRDVGRPGKPRTFERGDLRHSLREKRAARKIAWKVSHK